MSDYLLELFGSVMSEMPYTTSPELDAAEKQLDDFLGEKGARLLQDYQDAKNHVDWSAMETLFFTGMTLGLELGRLTT